LGSLDIWESDENVFVIQVPIHRRGESQAFAVIYAWGKPRIVYDEMNQESPGLKELRVDDIEWTQCSKNLFVNVLDWLAHEDLRLLLQKNAVISLASVEKDIRENYVTTYSDPKVDVSAKLQSHSIDGFAIREGFLRVVASATGTIILQVK
jgi:hypothetical protein